MKITSTSKVGRFNVWFSEWKAIASKYSSFETFYYSDRRARKMNQDLSYQKPIITQIINALYMIGFESLGEKKREWFEQILFRFRTNNQEKA